MSALDCLRAALAALGSSWTRSALTTLGIVIGVAAYMAMVAVGDGARQRMAETGRAHGADVLLIVPGSTSPEGASLGAGTQHTLTEADASALARELSGISEAVAMALGQASLVRGDANWSTTVVGADPSYFSVFGRRLASGTRFGQRDAEVAGKVVVLGPTVAERLFSETDPVGAVIRIESVPFLVVGVVASIGSSADGQDLDDLAVIPLSTAKRRVLGPSYLVNRESVDRIGVKVARGVDPSAAQAETAALLRQRHRLAAGRADDFSVLSLQDLFASDEGPSSGLAAMLATIAAISLVVGGVGIMSTMLVSVAERTPEIGLLLALGARRSDIRNQFLLEAVLICAIGGVVGVALGVGAAVGFAYLGDWPIAVEPSSVVTAVTVTVGVGVLSGAAPARLASRKPPVEALRSG